MANNFLPFCPTDTGTNLESQGDYAVAADRTNGNQPGVARSKLVNKALRQATFISAEMAQYVSDTTGTDTLDDAISAKMLAQMNATFKRYPEILTRYTSGSGTWNRSNWFLIATGSATTGATYTNNGNTFTVVNTVASGVEIKMTGNGEPEASGTLTKTGGTGDSTLTFYAVRKPLWLKVRAIGGGGGGGGNGTSGQGAGGTGGNSSFSTYQASGGGGGPSGSNSGFGDGGATNANTGSPSINILGARGFSPNIPSAVLATNLLGGQGGAGFFGGAGWGGRSVAGGAGAANSGGGGGGAGGNTTVFPGAGGASGSYFETKIDSPSATYSYAVGAAGTAGTAGTSGNAGGAGGSGLVIVEEFFQ